MMSHHIVKWTCPHNSWILLPLHDIPGSGSTSTRTRLPFGLRVRPSQFIIPHLNQTILLMFKVNEKCPLLMWTLAAGLLSRDCYKCANT